MGDDAVSEAADLASKWFVPSVARISAGNDVTAYVTGKDAFAAIADALVSADVDENSFVLLLGWSCQLDFELKPGDKASTLRALLTTVDARKTSIRAMLWKNTFPGFDNAPVNTFIQGLKNADAILDNRTAIVGSHHQKMLIVYGKTTTVAFNGGMDIFSDRIVAAGSAPLHDVHCRVQGPACDDLLATFVERWNDHPAHQQKFNVDLQIPGRPQGQPPAGTFGVQVGRTYPTFTVVQNMLGRMGYQQLIRLLRVSSPEAAKRVPPIGDMSDAAGNFKTYAFTQGEQNVWAMIEKGISTAQRFIYLEDQYLVSRKASAALAARLRAHKNDRKFRVLILMCHTDLVDLEQAWQRRAEFVSDLVAADPTRTMWSICYRAPVGSSGSYVHSKTWIFDDELVVVGSANCSRRSFTNDSECDIGVVGRPASTAKDGAKSQSAPSFAQQLRCALWAKHLGKTPADWTDAMRTASAWFSPPKGSKILRYNERQKKDGPSPKEMKPTDTGYQTLHDMFWSYVLEPDGS